jgi:hypothetical protein
MYNEVGCALVGEFLDFISQISPSIFLFVEGNRTYNHYFKAIEHAYH